MKRSLVVNFLWLFLLLPIYLNVSSECYEIDPEVDLNLEDRIKSHGYSVEMYPVYTEDDYILQLYHIPHRLKNTDNESKNKSVVLLVHGMAGSPHTFFVLGKKASVPYYMTDRDFDVWMFSSRGVDGSFEQKHRKYDWNQDSDYWFYSLHEIGIYDLPATIDFVLNHTGQTKLSLIGHSAAGNEFFAMFSEKPEYNDKVKVAISWACSPILKRSDYPLASLFSALSPVWKGLFKYLKMTEFLPMLQSFKPMLKIMCADREWQKLCLMGLWLIGTHRSRLQKLDDVQVIISNIPRLSNRQLYHFMDNYNNGLFRKYDYGPRKNMKLYGQIHPPAYNLSAATIPVAFFVAPHDGLIVLEDIYESVAQIPNTVMIYQVPFKKFNHVDFIFARNATRLVYEPTFKLLRDIDNGIIPAPIIPPPINDDF